MVDLSAGAGGYCALHHRTYQGFVCPTCSTTVQPPSIGTTGVHVPTIQWVVDWLRGEEGEKCRVLADMQGVPVEDTLAAALERRWLS